MSDDLSENPPWNDPQIPTGLDSRRVYTRAVAVGGARRRRRRQRRTVGVTVLCILILAPVVGLATRKGHGPQVVVAGHGATSTTAGQPTTVPAALKSGILAIGDSVMLGAEQSLQRDIPGIFVDAKVTRQFWDATSVLKQYKTEGLVPPTIVVHLGNNGAITDAQFAEMMSVVGNRKIFFVNLREPKTWETEVNDRLFANVQKYPNAHLIDWHDRGNQHPDWFVSDGIHLNAAGAQGYAQLIRNKLRGVPTPTTSTSTLPTTVSTTASGPTIPVAARGRWTDSTLIIDGTSLGNVKVGMTTTQAEQAAGLAFDGAGDGAHYPTHLPFGFAHLFVDAGDTVFCVGAETSRIATDELIATPEGFRLGDTVARLKAIYGARLTYIAAPPTGISPRDGYVVAMSSGFVAFSVDAHGTVWGITAGHRGFDGRQLTPSTCIR